MITLNDIAEIAGISKPSAPKMALRHDWPMRKAIRGGKRINLYNITRDEIKNAIVQTAQQKQKKRLAALGIKLHPEQLSDLSTEIELLTVEQIRKKITTVLQINQNTHRVIRIIKNARWEQKLLLKKGKWTAHYNVSDRQIADAANKYNAKPGVYVSPPGSAKLPFDAGWVSECGEAPTLTILKKLDDLTTPWGAHPAKSIIKPREIFPAAA
jgi:hypothetical protein